LSFFQQLDKTNLAKANQDIQDILIVAQFSPQEVRKFLSRVKKELHTEGISLDYLASF